MEDVPVSVTAHIIGRVQGVGFRFWTEREAQTLGLSGWVANEADGSVRTVLTGRRDAVALMLDKLRQGPPLARVDRVVSEPTDPEDSDDEGFRIIG
ncbi:MAG: acylphosphatase [Amaricoccus sp.]